MHSFSAADIPEDWRTLLGDYFESIEWQMLQTNLRSELNKDAEKICPEPQNFFKALTLTPLTQVKVVVLGQDPYHSPGLAQGLAFSIPANIPINSRQFPSSLRNISKALALEGFGAIPNGDLHGWAEQGVLLLNTALSVRLGEAGSHVNLGWKSLIDRLIENLALQKPYLVWMLWGGHAQSKLPLIETAPNQSILQSSHPSGLGVYKTDQPFLQPGAKVSCGHFTKANEWLVEHHETPISWTARNEENIDTGPQSTLFN
ncbi:uracil-DNA glycosylase [Polynucleobacter sp. AM-7D1]|uniref:uracil-DNA glycosylase n=1 Tax=Polynucleobacter sp. AM-7D1 TaxID=2689102 RepID=UPI001BFD4011|nr:uracil-DNA glycosylase [Polynucleobacter sp. AM-7D1]QWE28850.1 uracil-DNA glycosylase [Polynucleobacter sp. AM-7D1]